MTIPELHPPQITVHIDKVVFHLEDPHQTGASLKALAGIPSMDTLFLDHAHEDVVIPNEQAITLKSGESFHSEPPADYGQPSEKGHQVTIHINKGVYVFENPTQTGASLKELAGIPSPDTLFLDHAHEDVVIPNGQSILLKSGDSFHSEPPANYGKLGFDPSDIGQVSWELVEQPDGWGFLILKDFSLPEGFLPRTTQVLIKLPPVFPEAAPDMFWVSPQVHLTNGAAPQGTSPETLLGESWQRFSWHLAEGAWKPGISGLRDFLRCIRGRFERRN